MKKNLLLLSLITFGFSLFAQTIVYVRPDGVGSGTSWGDACSLEHAADMVLSEGSQIWVQKGTYYPSKMLNFPDFTKIYGGFEGTETDWLERDSLSNATIIDGQKKIGSVIRVGISSEINGFVIQNGSAKEMPIWNGGGVFADDFTVIANCIIRNNYAFMNGGGVCANGYVYIINSIIENNTAKHGPDIFGCCIEIIGGNCIAPYICSILPEESEFSLLTVNMFSLLTIEAVGTGPFSYQWYANKEPRTTGGFKVGGDSAFHQPSNEMIGKLYYYCVVTNECGSDTSNLSGPRTVCVPLAITAHPSTTPTFTNPYVPFPTLSVSITGSEPVFQWYVTTKDSAGGGIEIGTDTQYFRPPSDTLSKLYYYCVVSNACGSVTSNVSGLQTVSLNFNYTGATQTAILDPGTYKIECWGAQGGNQRSNGTSGNQAPITGTGSKGGYATGTITVTTLTTYYVYVGQFGGTGGTRSPYGDGGRAGWNGGGTGGSDADNDVGGGGGGASDIRLVSGAWNNATSLRSRVMVAGGGGGSHVSGVGGGVNGGTNNGLGQSTQTTGYAFGYGQTGGSQPVTGYVANGGGGGGWYGGRADAGNGSAHSGVGGNGGSGFISGHPGCNAINAGGAHTGSSTHYSGVVFTNTVLTAGNASIPNPRGAGNITGNSGNGYVRITKLDE